MIGGIGGVEESCRGMFMAVAGNAHHSAFWQAHEQFPQRPEFCDFKEYTGANSAPVPYTTRPFRHTEIRTLTTVSYLQTCASTVLTHDAVPARARSGDGRLPS